MNSKRVLAFDFGASSGRALLCQYNGTSLSTEEIHRFSNDPVSINGTLFWDTLRLFFEIKQGITKAVAAGGFDAIGIDTWGVDFGLIGADGQLLQNPVHYRDERTVGIPEEVFSIVSQEEVYAKTGIQTMRLNTLFQLYYLSKYQKDLLSRTETLLYTPDLFAYFLTGVKRAEYSISSTTQMLNPATGQWDFDLLERLNIPTDILPEIIDAGDVYGPLKADICEELGCESVPVIAVCTHDTASAVVSVPADTDNFLYISCGTWSLFGTESQTPIISPEAMAFNITNEGGYGRTTRFLKNIMGLWLIQESRRQWMREGETLSYGELERLALAENPFACFVDPDDEAFSTPGNLPRRVREFCQKTGQYVPQTKGEIMRCIYESLAMKYRYTMENLQKVTGQSYEAIHMIGGGTKDNLLCQMTADSCNTKVIAGPIEATGLGNAAVQFMALGDIDGLQGARKVIKNSLEPLYYTPSGRQPEYEAAYGEFKKIL